MLHGAAAGSAFIPDDMPTWMKQSSWLHLLNSRKESATWFYHLVLTTQIAQRVLGRRVKIHIGARLRLKGDDFLMADGH